MDNLIYIIFLCMALPLLLSFGLLDNKARLIIGYIILGAFMCVFVSEVNGLIRSVSNGSLYYITTNYTPMTEELVKALPILIFAFLFSDDRTTLLSISMALGIGFAIVENVYIFTSSGNAYDLLWAVKRVFGASLMHGLCTSAVGYGLSFIRKRKKVCFTGTFALLITAAIFHSIYNSLVQSQHPTLGFILPVAVYLPFIWIKYREDISESLKKKAAAKKKAQAPATTATAEESPARPTSTTAKTQMPVKPATAQAISKTTAQAQTNTKAAPGTADK